MAGHTADETHKSPYLMLLTQSFNQNAEYFDIPK